MKLLIFSDLHIHPHQSKMENIDNSVRVLDWVAQVYREQSCDAAVFCGDWSHVSTSTHNVVIDKTVDFFVRNPDIKMYALVGNHDAPWKSTSKNGLGYMRPFAHVVAYPETVSIDGWKLVFVPWMQNEQLVETLDGICEEPQEKSLLFLHTDFYSAVSPNGHIMKSGLNPSKYAKHFDYVFSGHFHNHQYLLKNVLYVGSPAPIHYGEEGWHGVLIFEDGKITEIENTFSPKYVTSDIESISKSAPNNHVRIVVDENDNMTELKRLALEGGALSVTFKKRAVERIAVQTGPILDDTMSPENILAGWISINKPENLDGNLLRKLGEEFLGAE